MTPVLHACLPPEMRANPLLPGVQPLAMDDWLRVDEAYAGQMARRDALLARQPDSVCWCDPAAHPAAVELLDMVLDLLPGLGFTIAERARRPDGQYRAVDLGDPLGTLGRLLQNDFCLMEKQGAEHVLTGAVLCFPASWTLKEKAGRPLERIHRPVAAYDVGLARRVQRLFDGVQVGRPLWRYNRLAYADPDLFHPRREADRTDEPAGQAASYLRAERQCILRLPETRAVVFSIHTYVVRNVAD